jgi:transposase InsO family protein
MATADGQLTKEAASGWFGISRQAYYQAKQRQLVRSAEEQLLVALVQGIRQRHPRMGGRKLYHELQTAMSQLGIRCGRDAFFALLRQRDLLVPLKRSGRRTTQAGLWRCPNLLAAMTITQVHQAWVADITYITTEAGFRYLALLTDAYSRFIVGYDLSSSLVVEGTLRALQQALAQTDRSALRGLIHHSDHGVQYAAWPYRELLRARGLRSSMGAIGNCYENALAERVNGILKNEYGLHDLFVDDAQAHMAVRQAIWLYNYERPHQSLGLAKPAQRHFATPLC